MTIVRRLRSIERYPSSVAIWTPPLNPRSLLVATSRTENTIDYGDLTFVIHEPNFSISPGMRVRATAVGGTSHWMEGPVVSYDGQILVVHIDLFPTDILYGPAFLRTFDNWNIGAVGLQGMQGKTGDEGPMGLEGPNLLEPGEQGPEGIEGLRGQTGTTIKGNFASLAELQASHPFGMRGDGYIIGTQRDLYIWNADEDSPQWRRVGNIAGSEGPTGPVGPQGLRGHGLQIHGIADDETSLRAMPTTDFEEGHFWITKDDQRGWFWDGTDWIDAGMRPLGPTGPQGPIGNPGIFGLQGDQGPPGLDSIVTSSIEVPLNTTAQRHLRLATRTPMAVISGRLGLNVLEPLTLDNDAINLIIPTDAIYGFKGTEFEKIWTTGDVKIMPFNRALDPGWLQMDDGTIGDASSNANHRGPDYEALFELFFDEMADEHVQLFNSAGTGILRSIHADALAAWNAHCRMALPKMLGRALAMTGAGEGLAEHYLGESVGAETHTMTAALMASHGHGLSGNANSSPINQGAGSPGWFAAQAGHISWTNAGGGSSTPFPIMQPTSSFLNIWVRL